MVGLGLFGTYGWLLMVDLGLLGECRTGYDYLSAFWKIWDCLGESYVVFSCSWGRFMVLKVGYDNFRGYLGSFR